MARLFGIAILVWAALSSAGGDLAVSQEPTGLAGRWALNQELSQLPREVGFRADWMAGGADPSSGGAAPGGGSPRTAVPVLRISREDSMRNSQLTGEVRQPAARLTIAETPGEVVITPDSGSPRTLHPTGREELVPLDGVGVTTTTTREAGRLVVRYKVNAQHELRYTYSRIESPPQLVVEIQFVERGGGDTVRRVYEPAAETATSPSSQTAEAPPASSAGRPTAPAPDSRGVPATGSRGGTLDYDRRPGAQLMGLTSLGIVVEGLGPQAAKCGLRQEAIQAAMTKELSGAGFKVSVNSDEDTYLYVSVMTATLENGTCLSRYDATLYTHTTAGLSYHPTPVLVDVSLMHKGSLAIGAPAAHAELLLRGLQDIVGQFTARIREANKPL